MRELEAGSFDAGEERAHDAGRAVLGMYWPHVIIIILGTFKRVILLPTDYFIYLFH
jgi:hypothetical protein